MRAEAHDEAEQHDIRTIILFGFGSALGALLGLLLLRGIAGAMAAKAPGFWFVSRAAGVVAYVMLWVSTVSGILISSKAVKTLVPGPLAVTMHNVTAWLALGFAGLHAWSLLGDRVVPYSLAGILVPFASAHAPLLTGLGTLSAYVGLLVSTSFYFQKKIGYRAWRVIHALSYLMFVGVTVHSVGLGTDSSTPVMHAVYLAAGSSVLLLTLFRILTAGKDRAVPDRVKAGGQRRSET